MDARRERTASGVLRAVSKEIDVAGSTSSSTSVQAVNETAVTSDKIISRFFIVL